MLEKIRYITDNNCHHAQDISNRDVSGIVLDPSNFHGHVQTLQSKLMRMYLRDGDSNACLTCRDFRAIGKSNKM